MTFLQERGKSQSAVKGARVLVVFERRSSSVLVTDNDFGDGDSEICGYGDDLNDDGGECDVGGSW